MTVPVKLRVVEPQQVEDQPPVSADLIEPTSPEAPEGFAFFMAKACNLSYAWLKRKTIERASGLGELRTFDMLERYRRSGVVVVHPSRSDVAVYWRHIWPSGARAVAS